MRYRWTALAAVALAGTVAGALATALPAAAALVTSCVGEASDVTVPGDFVVPAGQSCELTNVTITGNTTVRNGANLTVTTSHLNGTLTVQVDGFAHAVGSTVTGATRLNSAFGAFVESSTLTGAVTVTDSGFFYGVGSSLTTVNSTNGETYLESARVARDITTNGDLLSDVYNSVILGGLSVTAANMGSVVCVSEIDGDAAFAGSGAGSGALLQIGASAPLSGCGFDVFAANLAVTDNVAPSYVSDNVVRGDLTCTGNTPAPVGSSDRIRGQALGQCAPGASANAAKAAAAPANTRKSDLRARVSGRVATAHSTAAKTGRASLARQ